MGTLRLRWLPSSRIHLSPTYPPGRIKATPVGNPLGRVGLTMKLFLLFLRVKDFTIRKIKSSARIIGAASVAFVATELRVKDPLNYANNFFCSRPRSDYSYLIYFFCLMRNPQTLFQGRSCYRHTFRYLCIL